MAKKKGKKKTSKKLQEEATAEVLQDEADAEAPDDEAPEPGTTPVRISPRRLNAGK